MTNNNHSSEQYALYVKATGLSQRKLSELLGVNPVTLNRRVNGKYPITTEAFALMYILANVEGITEDILTAKAHGEVNVTPTQTNNTLIETNHQWMKRVGEECTRGDHPGMAVQWDRDIEKWILAKEKPYVSPSLDELNAKFHAAKKAREEDNSGYIEHVAANADGTPITRDFVKPAHLINRE